MEKVGFDLDLQISGFLHLSVVIYFDRLIFEETEITMHIAISTLQIIS